MVNPSCSLFIIIIPFNFSYSARKQNHQVAHQLQRYVKQTNIIGQLLICQQPSHFLNVIQAIVMNVRKIACVLWKPHCGNHHALMEQQKVQKKAFQMSWLLHRRKGMNRKAIPQTTMINAGHLWLMNCLRLKAQNVSTALGVIWKGMVRSFYGRLYKSCLKK